MTQKQMSRFERTLDESMLAVSVTAEEGGYECKLEVYNFLDDVPPHDQVSAVVYSCNEREIIRVYFDSYSGSIVIENLDVNESIEIKLDEEKIPKYPLGNTGYFAKLAKPGNIAELEAYLKDYLSLIVLVYLDKIARV